MRDTLLVSTASIVVLDYTGLNEGYTISQYSINSGPGIM